MSSDVDIANRALQKLGEARIVSVFPPNDPPQYHQQQLSVAAQTRTVGMVAHGRAVIDDCSRRPACDNPFLCDP